VFERIFRLVENQRQVNAMVTQDEVGRFLEATVDGDGFAWELWVDLQTKEAVVRKRLPNNDASIVCELTIPKVFVSYQHLLQQYVKTQK
jgi:hypothetical protein